MITHDPKKAEGWKKAGAEAAIADVHDTNSLREAFRGASHIFILNPPAPVSKDIDKEELHSVATILEALRDFPAPRLVAESTYSAQKGEHTADSAVLFEMEEGLRKLPNPLTILRGAYYMSNWDAQLESARNEGVIRVLYPADFSLPMVAPADIGAFAARLLNEPAQGAQLHHVEGPSPYSIAEVAAAFAAPLHRPVKVETIPPERFIPELKKMGFSDPAAESMANMTRLALARPERPENPYRGSTTLASYIRELVQKAETKRPPQENAEAS